MGGSEIGTSLDCRVGAVNGQTITFWNFHTRDVEQIEDTNRDAVIGQTITFLNWIILVFKKYNINTCCYYIMHPYQTPNIGTRLFIAIHCIPGAVKGQTITFLVCQNFQYLWIRLTLS